MHAQRLPVPPLAVLTAARWQIGRQRLGFPGSVSPRVRSQISKSPRVHNPAIVPTIISPFGAHPRAMARHPRQSRGRARSEHAAFILNSGAPSGWTAPHHYLDAPKTRGAGHPAGTSSSAIQLGCGDREGVDQSRGSTNPCQIRRSSNCARRLYRISRAAFHCRRAPIL